MAKKTPAKPELTHNFFHSVRFKMIFFTTLVLFIMIMASISLTSIKMREILQDQILSDFSALANSRVNQVVSIIEQDYERVSLIASRTQLRLSLIDYIDDAVNRDQTRNNIINIIQDAKGSVSSIININIISLDGNVVASTNHNNIDQNDSDKDWFLHGTQGNYQTIFRSENSTYIYSIAMPLIDPVSEQGNVIGIVKTDISLDRLMTILTDRTGLGETGEIILASKEDGKIFVMNPLLHQSNAALTHLNKSDTGSLQAIRSAIQGNNGILREPDYRGVETLKAYNNVPIDNEEWGLVIKVDASEVFAPINHILIQIILGGMVLLLMGGTTVSVIVNYITAPIGRLRAGTKKLGRGELEYRINITGKDELWDLASSFNEMAMNLQKITASRDDLEIEVCEREQAEEELITSRKKLEETHRLLEEEVNKAAEVHKIVLPDKIPQTETISIAAHYQPATLMGGDSYNIIKSGSKLIIYVADVMGHGLDGAMISVFIKEAIDSYVTLYKEELYPQKILKHLSSQYYRENFPDEQLICIFLGVVDLDTNELKYSSAGFQAKPLAMLGNGEKKKLETSGLFISNTLPLEILTFKEQSLTLTPGSTILITTDGLTEQENGEEMFLEYHEKIFYDNSHLPPEAIVQAINKDFCFFNHNSLTGSDDITYMVLQVNRDKKSIMECINKSKPMGQSIY